MVHKLLYYDEHGSTLRGMTYAEGARTYWSTLKQLKFPIITIFSVVGFAFVANNSGMSITMAMAIAGTGVLFPFFLSNSRVVGRISHRG